MLCIKKKQRGKIHPEKTGRIVAKRKPNTNYTLGASFVCASIVELMSCEVNILETQKSPLESGLW